MLRWILCWAVRESGCDGHIFSISSKAFLAKDICSIPDRQTQEHRLRLQLHALCVRVGQTDVPLLVSNLSALSDLEHGPRRRLIWPKATRCRKESHLLRGAVAYRGLKGLHIARDSFLSFLLLLPVRSLSRDDVEAVHSFSPKAQSEGGKHGISMSFPWIVKKPPMMGLYISRAIHRVELKPSWAIV